MRSSDLTREQLDIVLGQVRASAAYLRRLALRMEQRGFPRDDRLRALVDKAYDALHELTVILHYAKCGRPGGMPLSQPSQHDDAAAQ
jgi:hypothetical protein